MLGLIKGLEAKYGIHVQHTRCNDYSENQDFERACMEVGVDIKFEYTAPVTPQQNGYVV